MNRAAIFSTLVVALYGIGVGAGRVRGVIEQNRIFDIMMRAYGWRAD